jgi:undecaprenyl-diphosphatase
MPVVASVLGASLCALLVVLAAEWTSASVAGDTESTERWFVGHAGQVRGLRRVVAALDRYVWGGAMVGFGLLTVLLAGAGIGWIFSTIDEDAGFARFDESVAEWGSEHATEASTATLKAITHLGDTPVLLVGMALLGLVLVVRRPGHRWSVLGFLLVVGVGVSVINNTLKWLVMRDRPAVDHLVDSGGTSFPSGHSAAAAACWAAVALVVSRRMRVGTRRFAAALAVAIAVAVAASRVMLGVHWLTDVVAGLIVGWAWFFVVALVFGGRIQRFGEPAERMASTVDAERAHAIPTDQASDDLPTVDVTEGAVS